MSHCEQPFLPIFSLFAHSRTYSLIHPFLSFFPSFPHFSLLSLTSLLSIYTHSSITRRSATSCQEAECPSWLGPFTLAPRPFSSMGTSSSLHCAGMSAGMQGMLSTQEQNILSTSSSSIQEGNQGAGTGRAVYG
jgi:hypothetical protein